MGSFAWWRWISMQHLKQTDLCFQKWYEEFSKFSSEHVRKSTKIGTLMGSFYPKKKIYELKIYSGNLCHDNEEWYKIWRGIDLSVQNWHEEFHKLWPERSKIPEIYCLIGCFWRKYVILRLKKVYRSFAWWNWILMQHLKENWLVLSKMTWGI